VRSRRRARELALQVLYQLDVQESLGDDQGLSLFWQSFGRAGAGDEHEPGDAHDSDESTRVFTEELVRGVRRNLAELDGLLAQASRNWRLERMARVDRNLLRLALYEIRHSSDVPAKVAINEAIEIAKRFGTVESPAFVNGVLDRCLTDLGHKK
jgi:N utilization substance protein B